MKNRTLKLLILITAALLLLAGCGTAKTPRKAQEIIEEMVVDQGSYGAEASDRVKELLKELSSADSNLGTRWSRIT